MIRGQARRGFTIVELLIVIVVIAILASISVVAYNGIQQRTNDAKRISDISKMVEALELYKIDNGEYPDEVLNPGHNTWERSFDSTFLDALQPYGANRLTAPPTSAPHAHRAYNYKYMTAGAHGCPASMGPFYVLWTNGMEAQEQAYVDDGGCTTQNLYKPTPTPGAYTTHSGYYVIFRF